MTRKKTAEEYGRSLGKLKLNVTTTKNEVKTRLKIPRPLILLFHPAILGVSVMMVIISFRIYQLASTVGSSSTNSSRVSQTNVGLLPEKVDYTAKNVLPSSKLHTRFKRDIEEEEEEDYIDEEQRLDSLSPEGRSVDAGEIIDDGEGRSSSDIDEYKLPSNRRAAESTLDDILLDAETPLPATSCLNEEETNELEERQHKNLVRLRHDGRELSEHMEDCQTTDDCLILSPYTWLKEGSEEECRKKTFLRCDSGQKLCTCQDRFDLRWDTEVEQSVYQWNPITKTCYVRGSNPCKLDIPCAPGTVCRSTVSISYNTPPIQRICECENIEHLLYSGSDDWWYCGHYSQRAWFFAFDNIEKWKHQPFHLYVRMRASQDANFTARTVEGQKG